MWLAPTAAPCRAAPVHAPLPCRLQQHVAFWDPDRDGVIWPGDTFRGFRWGWVGCARRVAG